MMRNDVLARFPDAKKDSAGWAAKCPAHDDRRASLSIGKGDDDRWLLHCHAGCSAENILAAAGLVTADLFPNKSASTKPAIVATYQYRDEGGAHLFDVVRFEPKDFRQRRADGTWKMTSVRRILYRLPELQGRTQVFVVEGEKDTDRLRTIGLAATTAPGGAGKWQQASYPAQLVAAAVEQIIILPDNDAPGREHADDVARSCHAAGLEVKVVALPDVPPKGDVSDFLDAGHNKADLVALATATAVYTPGVLATPTTITRSKTTGGPAPVLVRLADVTPEAVDFLWPARVARRKLQVILGDPGLGKSTITLDIAARVTKGAGWPDGGAAPSGSVIVMGAEDGLADTVRPRLDALGADATRVHALTGARLANGDERAITLGRDLAVLEQAIATIGDVVLVVIDPLSAYLGDADSHKDAEVRNVLAPVAALADRTGVAIVAVMHMGKGAQRPALHRALGSIAFVAAARLVLGVAVHPDDDEKRVLAPVKSNICAPAPTLAYRLDAGRLVWDADPVVNVDVEALFTPATDRHERRESDDWLTDALGDGPRGVRELQAMARGAGLVWRTVERAKARLHVQADHAGFGGSSRWFWRLPKADTSSASTKTATHAQVSVFEETHGNGQRPTLRDNVAVFGRPTPLSVFDDADPAAFGEGPCPSK